MKRVLIILLSLFLSGSALFAAEYNILVIPAGLVGIPNKTTLANSDIEEILTRNIINKLEFDNIACAPNMSTLKISIKNNPNFISKAINPINNAKIISKSYGISKIILVKSNIEVISAAKQKELWKKMELPVVTPLESNIRLVTTVTLLNTQNDNIIWSNVFYKNINCIGNGINNYNSNETKLSAITKYYDDLSIRIIEEIRECKDTSAIMVNTKSNQKQEVKPKKTPVIHPVSQVKPDFKVRENIPQPVKHENKIKKFTETVKTKYDNAIQEHETKKIKKLESEVNELLSPSKKEEKPKIIKQKPAKKEKEIRPAVIKENKTPITDKIKEKYNTIKENHAQNIENKKDNAEKAVNYSNVMRSEDGDTPPVNNYIQTKPRKNSRKYTPQFDSSINDI